jgi:hypothetical protein
MTTHTLCPWKVIKTTTPGQFGWEHVIRSADNSYMCKMGPCSPEETAERIVRAVNAHDDLLSVAKGCLGYLQGLPEAARPDPAWLQPLIAAIAAAEGRD